MQIPRKINFSIFSKEAKAIGVPYIILFIFFYYYLLLFLLAAKIFDQNLLISIFGSSFVLISLFFILQSLQHFRIISTERDLFKNLLENAPDATIIIDEAGSIQMVNAQTQYLFGYEKEELLGKEIEILLPEQFRSKHVGQRESFLKNPTFRGMGKGLDLFGRRKEGSKFDAEISLSPIKTKKGLFVSASVRDISERKNIKRALLQSEEKWKTLFSLLPVGISILNKDGKIVEINQALEKILSISKEGLLSGEYKTRKYFHENGTEVLPGEFPSVVAIKEKKEVHSNLIQVKKEDDSIIWTEVSASPLPFEDPACVVVTRDVTHIREYEDELIELNNSISETTLKLELTNKELIQFAHVVSHDLQEPLRMVTSFLTLLKDHLGDKFDETADEYMYFAVDGAMRMKNLILDLLEYARTGNQVYKFEKIKLNNLMEELLHLNSTVIKEKNAKVIWSDLPEIEANEAAMLQLFSNLVTNGIKYQRIDTLPEIKIQCEDKPDCWLFSISDNGIGIEEKYLEKIFAVFQRLHSNEEYPGTGIGLAICKKIVDKHLGGIWTESDYGKGSTFYFTIKKNLQSLPKETK